MIDLSVQKSLEAPNGEMILEVDLQIATGQLVSLSGKSGAGKTSLLRLLAGLAKADKGRIQVNGELWLDTRQKIYLPPQQRKIGFVFQDYALFPNMTVAENLRFALPKGQSDQIIREIIDIIELGDLQKRKPQSLSGGQQQRVALARALVQRPNLLLLDEPLSALDPEMRYKLQEYILQVHRQYGLTTLLISHDVGEILRMADHSIQLEDGKVIRQGRPVEVFGLSQADEQFNLRGEIIEIEPMDNGQILHLLCGTVVLKVKSDLVHNAQWKIGDKVHLSAEAFQANIHKSG